MTKAITLDEAQKALQSRPPYATIKDFDEILNSRVRRNFTDDTKAIDVLDMPLTSTTTLPHWVIAYLYAKKDIDIEESDLIIEANNAGYQGVAHMRYVRRFLEETQANIGVWWDSNKRKTYYRWYKPDKLTKETQESLDRGDDW